MTRPWLACRWFFGGCGDRPALWIGVSRVKGLGRGVVGAKISVSEGVGVGGGRR